jgi:tetratricopeptide (TPR) repeat protein
VSSPASDGAVDGEFSREHHTNPALRLMLANLRRFGFVIAGMIALLIVCIMALRMIWAFKDRQLQTSIKTSSGTVAKTPDTTPGTATATNTSARPIDLNTEAIRRAVFLAKHAESLELNKRYDDAIARYREALDIWPYLTTAWSQLGRLYLRTRDYPRAQIALEKAVENNPSEADLLNDLGVAYMYQGKVDKARNLFDAAMEIDPHYAPSLFNLALTHISRNDRGQARDGLVRYLRIKPDDPRALRELAFLDALESRYEDAMDSLEKALARAADWPLLYFDAAAVSALMGRPDQAVGYLEKAEPLTDPATVYRLYQESAFREIRLTELGKMFETELATRARERISEKKEPVEVHAPSEPIPSTESSPATETVPR